MRELSLPCLLQVVAHGMQEGLGGLFPLALPGASCEAVNGCVQVLTATGLATPGALLVAAHKFQKPGWLWELQKSGKTEVWVCAYLHLLAVRKLTQIVGSSWASLKANAEP